MVAHAQATESERDFGAFVDPEDAKEQADFRGSFSGYERDAFFLSPGAGQPFIEVGYGLRVDDDDDGRAVAPLDVDGDGDLDLVVMSLQGMRLYLNPSPPAAFVRVRLKGGPGNPQAVGAVVLVSTADRTQVAPVTLTAGFHTQIQAELHFGLGTAPRVEGLEVRWPSGKVERFGPQPKDRVLVVEEGKNHIEVQGIPRWPAALIPRARAGALAAPAETLEGQVGPLARVGRPVVVNFWAPWCAACETELPALAALAKTLEGKVSFVGVSLERKDKAGVAAFAERHGLGYPIRLATDALVDAFFGTGAEITLPVTFVFEADGSLRRAFYRAITAEDLQGVLGSLEVTAAPEDYIELSDQAHKQGRLADEAALLKQALAAAPDDPVTLADVAQRMQRVGDPEGALALLETSTKRLPEVADLWALLASARGGAGDLKGAEVAIQRALQLAPKNPVALNSAGMLLLSRGKVPEAVERFTAALEADPLYGLARANLAHAESLLPPPPEQVEPERP